MPIGIKTDASTITWLLTEDDGGTDPLILGTLNPIHWYDVSQESYTDAQVVTTLTDRGSDGANLVNNTGSREPTYSAADDALIFDGATLGQYLQTSGATLLTDDFITDVFVAEITTQASNLVQYDGEDATGRHTLDCNTTNTISFWAGNVSNTSVAASTAGSMIRPLAVYILTFNNSGYAEFLENGFRWLPGVAASCSTGTNDAKGFTLGTRYSLEVAQATGLKFRELARFNRRLGMDEQIAITKAMKEKWGEVSEVAAAPAEFSVVMRTTGASETVTLPMSGNNNLDIDWGDGSSVETGVTSNNPSHVYATADDYTIKVTGDTDALQFDGSGQEAKLIEVVSGGTDFRPGNLANAFHDCTNLTSANVSGMDTSGVSNMESMFRDCTSLTSLDVSDFNTSGVLNMRYMFRDCRDLTSLDLSNFDTSSVSDIDYMFYNCQDLTSLNLSGFDTSGVSDMRYMFWSCSSLTSLDLSSFNTSGVSDMRYMFYNCSGLTSLDISSFNTSSVDNMFAMFMNCSSLTSDPGIVNFDFSAVTDASFFASGANAMLSTAEYNAILVKMDADRNGTVTAAWHFGDATYDASAGGNDGTAARASLVADGDSFTDGGPA